MASLEKRIRASFANTRYPGDDRLTMGGSTDESFDVLKGKTWQELPVKDFMSGDTPIPDLTLEAFHYYMPALLIASLDEFPDLASSLTFYLTPSECAAVSPEHGSECLERLSLFDAEQRKVIADVLREFVQRGWEDEATVREATGYLENAD